MGNKETIKLQEQVTNSIENFISTNFSNEKDKPYLDIIRTLVKGVMLDMKNKNVQTTKEDFTEKFFEGVDYYALNTEEELHNFMNSSNPYMNKLYNEVRCDMLVAFFTAFKLKIFVTKKIGDELAVLTDTYKIVLENEGIL